MIPVLLTHSQLFLYNTSSNAMQPKDSVMEPSAIHQHSAPQAHEAVHGGQFN